MLSADELTGMRETSLLALPDNVAIVRPAPVGEGDFDPETGVWIPAAADPVWSGKGRVRPPTAEDLEVLFGEQQVTKQRYVGTFPYDIPIVEIDDVVTVTSGSDPHITGRSFRVTGHSSGSWLIDRRVALETVE